MAIPYQTAKLKSANYILAIVILGSTAKFTSRQYFRLYGIIQGSISKLNLACITMLSSDPHSLSMYRDVEAIIESVDSISRDGLNTCMPL